MVITIDGVDKTGKNLLHRYLEKLTNYKYVMTDRGILTQLAYNEKFGRGYKYNLEDYKNNIIVYLTAEDQDLEIRCKVTNEPKFDIPGDKALFEKHLKTLEEEGFEVIRYNTTDLTPYRIAEDLAVILKKIEEKRNERV